MTPLMFACLFAVTVCGLPDDPSLSSVTALASDDIGHRLAIANQSGVFLLALPDAVVSPVEKCVDINWMRDASAWPTKLENVHDLAFSPDGRLLAVAGGTPGQFGLVEIHDAKTGARLQTLSDHDDCVMSVAWSPDNDLLVSAGMDGNVIGYRVTSTGNEPSASESRTVMMERFVHVTGHTQPVTSVNLLVDRGTLLMASGGLDHTILLTDPSRGTSPAVLRTLNNHTGPIVDLSAANAVTNDESALLASVSEDRTVRFWQPGTGRLMRFVRLDETPTAVVLSKDGRKAVVGDEAGKVTVIETATARVVRTIPTGMSRVVSLEQDQSRSLVYIGGAKSQIQVLAVSNATP